MIGNAIRIASLTQSANMNGITPRNTVPVFFPLIVHLGLDPIWFGILIVVVVEIGLISPPVGMNLFVINALLPQVPTRTVFHGVLPFMVADVVRLAILVAFPIISLWLPSLMR